MVASYNWLISQAHESNALLYVFLVLSRITVATTLHQ